MKIANSMVDTVGNTPLIRLNHVTKGLNAEILLKAEFFNPLFSVKDRIGRAMIEAAERDGSLKPGGLIIEPTSGNTGIALAFVARAKGYRCILTMPESMSVERRVLLRLLGAEIVLTPRARGMGGAIAMAKKMLEETPGAFGPGQFDNPANPQAHRDRCLRGRSRLRRHHHRCFRSSQISLRHENICRRAHRQPRDFWWRAWPAHDPRHRRWFHPEKSQCRHHR
jgi:cysteine synthase